jgi:uncharacterized protein (DUF58 family)
MRANADKIPGISIEVEELVSVRGLLSGLSSSKIRRRSSYRSGARDRPVRGRGMEYEESRAYVSGDDVKAMDWRVMARTGEAYTKVFAEERERRFVIAVDLSASMFFGTRYSFKSWSAAQVAAHVGWLASFAGDRIGGLIALPGMQYEVRPGKTRSGLLGVFHYLAQANQVSLPPDVTHNRLNFLLRELNRVVKPGTIIALISDFIGFDEQSLELLSGITRHSDIHVYWIHDDTELNPWPGGHYRVMNDQQSIGIDISSTDTWLSQRQHAHRQRLETATSGLAIPLFPVSCNRAITPQILKGLNQ